MGTDEALAAGRAALAAGRWKEAAAAFEAALTDQEKAEALDGLAQARAGLGEYGAAVRLRERAYAAFRQRGEIRRPAVLAAYWLAFEYVALYGNHAAASGWLERGKRLADVSGDCPERGWVELACALAVDDVSAKQRHITAASAIAGRFGDADLEFDARAYAGICLVQRGDVDEGMRRLDEAVAAATGGEVHSPAVAGEIYCKMLLACEMVLDVRRAEQWASVVEAFTSDTNTVWASAICRMYYGGILTAAGRWAEADHELSASLRLYDASYRALRSGSVVRLADLRVRQGRFEEAECLLTEHHDDSYAVRPYARLHLARGNAELAVNALRRRLAQTGEGLLQAPILVLLAEGEVAAGRYGEAEEACLRLTSVATRSAQLRAHTRFVAGLVSRDADQAMAIEHFEAAVAAFAASGLPLEEARARLELAVILGPSQRSVALAETQTALRLFERLGARPDIDRAASVLRSLGGRTRTGSKEAGVLSQREREVLRLVGLGFSNPEIAARLFISRKTVAHHVSHVLAKLGLRNRAEAAAHASTVLTTAPE